MGGITLWKWLLIAEGIQGDSHRWLRLADESLLNCLVMCVHRAQINGAPARAKCCSYIHGNKEELLLGASCVFGFSMWQPGTSMPRLFLCAFPLFTTRAALKKKKKPGRMCNMKCPGNMGVEVALNVFVRALLKFRGAGVQHHMLSLKVYVHGKYKLIACF